jgi:dipeptidyl aminopeptidase/acylaminoacyl peptidase
MTRLLALAILFGCGRSEASEPVDAPADAAPPRPLTLADVIAPVTADELAAVEAEWDARDVGAHDVTVVASGTLMLGQVEASYRVLEHRVDGELHYGAVLVPTAITAPAPVLVYAHGGYTGPEGLPPFDAEGLGEHIPGQPLRETFIYVIPAYRGERISVAGVTYTSEGTPTIGTSDVTDTAALLTATIEETPFADPKRVAILGESRGGIVAMALAARDERFTAIVVASAPTDFRIALAGTDEATFVASVAGAVAMPDAPEVLLTRSLVPLAEVTVLPDNSLEITAAGYAELRRRMAATSALANAEALPRMQLHHGTADTSADLSYARELAEAMAQAGQPSPSAEFTYFEYEGGGHGLESLPGSIARIATFLETL